MVEHMMQHNGALEMIVRSTGKIHDLGVKLFDQSLLVRGDDVHRPALPRHSLKSGYSCAASGSIFPSHGSACSPNTSAWGGGKATPANAPTGMLIILGRAAMQ